MGLLATFEDEVFQMWNLSISKKMAQSLKGSLIIRTQDEKSTLRVNFSRDLSSLLREVSPYSECVIPALYSLLPYSLTAKNELRNPKLYVG